MSLKPSSTQLPITLAVQRSEYFAASKFNRGDVRRVMSQSELKLFAPCPRRWLNGYRQEKTEATAWGSLIDALFLTPDMFDQEFAVCPETYQSAKGEEKPWDFRSSTCREWRDDQESAGVTVVTGERHSEARRAVLALNSDPTVSSFMAGAKTQVRVCTEWHDPSGIVVPIQSLIDIMPDGDSLGDLKTCSSAAMGVWTNTVFKLGYHMQAALYLDAFNIASGEKRVDFRHIIQESFEPYEVACRVLSAEYLDIGRLAYRQALTEYCECLKTGIWPGYRAKVEFGGWQIVEPIPWMISAGFDSIPQITEPTQESRDVI